MDPKPRIKKKVPAYTGPDPNLRNISRIFDTYGQDLGKPGVKSVYHPDVPPLGSMEDMQRKGLFGNTPKPVNWRDNFTPDTTSGLGKTSLTDRLNKLMPYASNIANTFRRPATPPIPENISPVTMPKVNLDNSRNEIQRQIRGANVSAGNTLDAQAATAVRQSGLATQLNALNDVNAKEAGINAQIGGEQAQLNAGIDMRNTMGRNQYGQQLTEMKLAQQRAQSENFANFSDKYIAQGNEQAKAQLEMDKYRTLTDLYKSSGVFDRYTKFLKDKGVEDPTGINRQYKTLTTMKNGGRLNTSTISRKLKI